MSHFDNSITLRARLVVPMTGGILEDARLTLTSDCIQSLTPNHVAGELDLGEVAILPAWVNAHTHLEFSNINEPLGHPGMHLAEWIPHVIDYRAGQTADSAVANGWRESTQAGTGLLADICQPLSELPFPEETIGGESIVRFCEVRGLSDDRASASLQAADQFLRRPKHAGVLSGISPHAPYSIRPDTVARCVELAKQYNVPLAMHLEENDDEEKLTMHGTGPFANALRKIGVWNDQLFPNGMRIVDWVQMLGHAPRTLLIHGNYLDSDALSAIARHEQMTVVICPRTHAYFQHHRHPIAELLAAGIRVAIGTDSRASNPDLDVAGEVRHLLLQRNDLAPRDVFAMATKQGADALGVARLGRIAAGAYPRLNILPLTKNAPQDLWQWLSESLLVHSTSVFSGSS